MATKANLKTLPIEHHIVSSSDIVTYLQNELGFAFDCDFKLYDNRGPQEKPMAVEKCFVLMRAVFRPEDICVKEGVNGYVDKILNEASANKKFKDNVIAVLEKFMFPENMAELRQHPTELQILASQGLYGDRLERLMRHPRFFYDEKTDRFGIALRPEKIIEDMCSDPATNKLDGIMAFGYVSDANQNASAITWGVNVYHNVGCNMRSGGVTIDAVFNSIKQG